MSTFKNILVPVDFSKSSARAVTLATELARAFDSNVTLLHVWEMPVYPYAELSLSTGDWVSAVEDAASKLLAESVTALQVDLPRAKGMLRMGVPWQQIIDTIKEQRPDLVVMGTHGRHGFSHAMLGSVAEKVVRLSPVPVLTTHAAP